MLILLPEKGKLLLMSRAEDPPTTSYSLKLFDCSSQAAAFQKPWLLSLHSTLFSWSRCKMFMAMLESRPGMFIVAAYGKAVIAHYEYMPVSVKKTLLRRGMPLGRQAFGATNQGVESSCSCYVIRPGLEKKKVFFTDAGGTSHKDLRFARSYVITV